MHKFHVGGFRKEDLLKKIMLKNLKKTCMFCFNLLFWGEDQVHVTHVTSIIQMDGWMIEDEGQLVWLRYLLVRVMSMLLSKPQKPFGVSNLRLTFNKPSLNRRRLLAGWYHQSRHFVAHFVSLRTESYQRLRQRRRTVSTCINYWLVTPICEKMIQFDLRILFKWVGSTTNQVNSDRVLLHSSDTSDMKYEILVGW